MDENRRTKYYHDLLILKNISLQLPNDLIEYMHMIYKYETIEERTKHHHKYEVLRELRVKLYYSKYMYKYYLELYMDHKKKQFNHQRQEGIIVITNTIETRELES